MAAARCAGRGVKNGADAAANRAMRALPATVAMNGVVNIRRVARAKAPTPQQFTVVVLDRPRHQGFIRSIRAVGARVRLIAEGDVAGAVLAAREGRSLVMRAKTGPVRQIDSEHRL